MRIVGIIPARFKSSRFPGKPLAMINGKAMILRVVEIVIKALGINNTYVATDDIRIRDIVESHGFKTIMTSENCLTGTDRIFEASKILDADIYVNIQGDEPLLNPEDIDKVVRAKIDNINYVINGMSNLRSDESPFNVNIPKVITNNSNDLIYISRLPVPGSKDDLKLINYTFKKQVCIYAFTKVELKKFGEYNGKFSIEEVEDIEILRFLDLGIKVRMVELEGDSIAVDVKEDVFKVEEELKKRSKYIIMYNTILWDFDGVILDSMSVREMGFRKIFSSYNKDLVDKLIEFHLTNGGLSRYVKIRYFYNEILNLKITEDEVMNLANQFSSIMLTELVHQNKLIIDSYSFIIQNYRNMNFHILSGSDEDELKFICKNLNIENYFRSIHGSPTHKTELVAKVMNENNYNRKNVCLIGDSLNDFDAAKNFGISFFGYNNENLKQMDRYLNSIFEIKKFLI